MTATTKKRARPAERLNEADGVRVALYVRISTDEEHQPYSLEAQEQRLRAYVTSQERWHLVKVFVDQKSGATLDRPELRRALDEAAAGRFDLLLVYRVDRLSRSVRGLAQILEDLDRAGVAFRSATEPFDTSSAAGRMMVQMLGVFAEFERATIVDRTIAGMERKAARGEWVAGAVPLGYERGPRQPGEPTVLVVDEARAPLVARIFELYVKERLGSHAVANWLNEQGLRLRSGRPFSHKGVLEILRNRTYLGEVFFRDTWHAGAHPPLVKPALFAKAQALLAQRGEDVSTRGSNSSRYLLAGVVTCARCGRRYVGVSATGRRARYRYYTCFSRNRYGALGCDAERLPAAALDDAVLDALVATYARHDLFARAARQAATAARTGRTQARKERAAVEVEIARAEAALARYFATFEAGTMAEADCGMRVRELNERLAALRARRDDLDSQIQHSSPPGLTDEELRAFHHRVEHLLHHGSDAQRKAVVRALIAEVRVYGRDHIEPVFRVPLDADAARVLIVGGEAAPTGFEPVSSP